MDIKHIITESLKKSITYEQYRDEIAHFVDDKSTSGDEQTEALIHYTLLNDRRMKRWDKTIKVPDYAKQKLATFKGDVTWLVLTESWCGDAAHVIPLLHKVAELSEGIALKLVYKDESVGLMTEFLTNGGQSIPKLIMIDNTTGDVLNTYGPRPSKATQLALDYKNNYGTLTPEFKEDLQRWYNLDKGQTIIEDLLNVLKL